MHFDVISRWGHVRFKSFYSLILIKLWKAEVFLCFSIYFFFAKFQSRFRKVVIWMCDRHWSLWSFRFLKSHCNVWWKCIQFWSIIIISIGKCCVGVWRNNWSSWQQFVFKKIRIHWKFFEFSWILPSKYILDKIFFYKSSLLLLIKIWVIFLIFWESLDFWLNSFIRKLVFSKINLWRRIPSFVFSFSQQFIIFLFSLSLSRL